VIVAEEGFGLCDGRRPKYKKGSKKARIPGFNCLISTLRELKASKPSLDVMSHCAVAKRVNMVPALLAGDINVTTDELKELEDILDALICAWVGLLWIEAPERCQLLPPPGFPNNSGDAVIVAPARHYDGLSKRRRKVFDLLHSYASSGQE
jgi:predicted RNase H-like nuclease